MIANPRSRIRITGHKNRTRGLGCGQSGRLGATALEMYGRKEGAKRHEKECESTCISY